MTKNLRLCPDLDTNPMTFLLTNVRYYHIWILAFLSYNFDGLCLKKNIPTELVKRRGAYIKLFLYLRPSFAKPMRPHERCDW